MGVSWKNKSQTWGSESRQDTTVLMLDLTSKERDGSGTSTREDGRLRPQEAGKNGTTPRLTALDEDGDKL